MPGRFETEMAHEWAQDLQDSDHKEYYMIDLEAKKLLIGTELEQKVAQ